MQTVVETTRLTKKHELAIMDQTGDTKVLWSKDNRDEVDAARAQFNTLVGKGYTAFRVDGKGERAGQMREFDADAERVILVPPPQAG